MLARIVALAAENVLIFFCLVLGFLQGVRHEFTDDVSETAVVPNFTGHE